MARLKTIGGLICLLVIITTFVLGIMVKAGDTVLSPIVYLVLIFALAVAYFLYGE